MLAKLVVFGSGRGSNFISIYNAIEREEINASVEAVFSNRSDAKILEFAASKNIQTDTTTEHSMLEQLERINPDFIVLAGFLKKIPKEVVAAFPNRIVNIHPSLLPSFGGHGMYGMNVHRAVWRAGVKLSGATVHFVNDVYDDGAILLQESVSLLGSETAEQIAEKVLAVEHKLFPSALKLLVEGRFKYEQNKVILT